MAVPRSIHDAKGLWHGKSLLNLSFMPPGKQVTESSSRLHIETDEHNTYATITYDWHHDGKRQEGTIILCKSGDSESVQIGWVDSWHQNTSVMHLVGEESANGSVATKGTYMAEKEAWGWTVSLQLEGEHLSLIMENITPDGKAEWAVRGLYKRD